MNRRYFKSVIALLTFVVIGGAFAAGLVTRQLTSYAMPMDIASRLTSLSEMAPGGGDSAKVTGREVDFGPMDTFLSVLKLVRKNYVDRVGDDYDNRFALQAVENMLASLRDPYSRLVSPQQREVLSAVGNGDFQGIGVILGARKRTEDDVKVQNLAVVTPISGGPADKAGIVPGDLIMTVNGKKIVETPADGRPSQGMKDLIDRLRKEVEKEDKAKSQTPALQDGKGKPEAKPAPKVGPKNAPKKAPGKTVEPVADVETIDIHEAMDLLTSGDSGEVSVTIERAGVTKPISLKIARAKLHRDPIETRMLDNHVLYVQIRQTSEEAAVALAKALKAPAIADSKALIVDLRRSPGGMLDPLPEIAGLIMPGQPLAQVARRNTAREKIGSAPGSSNAGKIIVLVDQGTASTSEILAQALRERAHATIIGTTTFGDTMLQSVIPLSDGSAVILTTGKLLTPVGSDLNGKGVKPDIRVTGSPTWSEKDDPVLKKAIEVIGAG